MSKQATYEELKKALLLAGRLAVAAQAVTTASADNLSDRVRAMNKALREYDRFMVELTNNGRA